MNKPLKKYSEKLKDPRWQKKRLEVMERDKFRCLSCGDEKSTLAVHHLYYVSGRNPWQYPMWSLQTLCEGCHDMEHFREEDYEEDADPRHEWEEVIRFFGVQSPRDFRDYWDVAVQVGMLRAAIWKQNDLSLGYESPHSPMISTDRLAMWLEKEARGYRSLIEAWTDANSKNQNESDVYQPVD